ncbi:hypothetical protein DFP72DRAFT_433188 [Ephemerocybe angulata]|uniref:Uncharacterized protein n=1 Tax=Ephemerocybe angulata TaxID=980116 RepID=A0A8H6HTK3_9AGAR|nr:hypothetical protein DFP72DRAFT_433188 [Tulosesus angulatus]
MLKALVYLITLASAAIAAPALRDTVDAPEGFAFTNPTFVGDGCLDGTASFAFAEDKSSFSLVFTNFTLLLPYDSAPIQTYVERACNFSVGVSIPAGYSFTIPWYEYTHDEVLAINTYAVTEWRWKFLSTPQEKGSRYEQKKEGKDEVKASYVFTDIIPVSPGSTTSRCGQDVVFTLDILRYLYNDGNVVDELSDNIFHADALLTYDTC